MTTELLDFLAEQASDNEVAWSLGTFGAIAEFARDADEPVRIVQSEAQVSAVTDRGGFRIEIHPGAKPIASESPTTESWSHRVALCMSQNLCAMNMRSELTEIGADRDALRDQDYDAVLFDLGLGTLQVDACVRSSDADVIGALRGCAGKSVFAPDSRAMRIILAANPHRVFMSRLGRIEVYQPIPPANGKSPDGPHTHVLPKLLAHGRTHSANEPVPSGWVPCAHCYPPHPLRDAEGKRHEFEASHYQRFQGLLAQYGIPEHLALKHRVFNAVTAGQGPDTGIPNDRAGRATIRISLRQLQALGTRSDALAAWLAAFDRTDLHKTEDLSEMAH